MCRARHRSKAETVEQIARAKEKEGRIDRASEASPDSTPVALDEASKHLQGATVHKQERAQWDAKDDKQTRKRREWAASEIRLRALDAPV